jgi:hypothetical protein
MTPTHSFLFRRGRKIVLSVLLIFALSFAGTDYYLRGQFYFTKRAINFIYGHTWQAIFPPSGPVELYVRMVADQNYRRLHPDWESRLRDLLDAVGRRFAAEFDIRFSLLSLGAWDRPESLADYAGILKYAARKINRHGADISVIMTAADTGTEPDDRWVDAGVAHYLGNCAIVGRDALLLHELGHLFGAVDYPPGNPLYDSETTYSYKYAVRTDAVDPANHARIMKNKYRLLW